MDETEHTNAPSGLTVDLKPQPPMPSKAASGCLLVPALAGGCLIMLGMYLVFGAVVSSWLGQEVVPGALKSVSDMRPLIPAMALSLGAWVLLRRILGGHRKPWIYWSTTLLLGLLVLITMPLSLFGVSWTGSGENVLQKLFEWFVFLTAVTIWCWFAFSPSNRRYYSSKPS
ncbi:MAG TPA: hypothetical protein PLB55_00840 [Prosthecobacter sp.]|nr:hypothetical protein [Prosthecobacter sp.]